MNPSKNNLHEKFFAFQNNPTFQVSVLEYSRNNSGKALFVEPPLWSKIIIGNTTFLSYPLHFVSFPTKPAPVFHNKLWEEECEKVLKVSSWSANSIKKSEFRVQFRLMSNRWLTVHCTPDKDPGDKCNIKEYFLQDFLCRKKYERGKREKERL